MASINHVISHVLALKLVPDSTGSSTPFGIRCDLGSQVLMRN